MASLDALVVVTSNGPFPQHGHLLFVSFKNNSRTSHYILFCEELGYLSFCNGLWNRLNKMDVILLSPQKSILLFSESRKYIYYRNIIVQRRYSLLKKTTYRLQYDFLH